MSNNLEYKKIVLSLDRLTNITEMNLILKINSTFSKRDLYVENSGNKIIFNFRSVDLNKLEELVANQIPFTQ
ncbi:MAG: hypothetical protein QXO39_06995, partial [Conexivisphaerales archaeon]